MSDEFPAPGDVIGKREADGSISTHEFGDTVEERLLIAQSPEKQYLVCRECGEAFDSITPAQQHGYSDLSGSAGWCGDDGFDILPESEAF